MVRVSNLAEDVTRSYYVQPMKHVLFWTTFFILNFELWAQTPEALELVRLDQPEVAKILLKDYPISLVVSENCPICDSQYQILTHCTDLPPRLFLLEHQDEERARQMARRKKMKPLYLLSSELKKRWKWENKTPAFIIKNQEPVYGLKTCEEIKARL